MLDQPPANPGDLSGDAGQNISAEPTQQSSTDTGVNPYAKTLAESPENIIAQNENDASLTHPEKASAAEEAITEIKPSSKNPLGISDGGFLSLAQAAQITGYHQDYLGQLARSGKLPAQKIGRNWVTTVEAVYAMKSGEDIASHANMVASSIADAEDLGDKPTVATKEDVDQIKQQLELVKQKMDQQVENNIHDSVYGKPSSFEPESRTELMPTFQIASPVEPTINPVAEIAPILPEVDEKQLKKLGFKHHKIRLSKSILAAMALFLITASAGAFEYLNVNGLPAFTLTSVNRNAVVTDNGNISSTSTAQFYTPEVIGTFANNNSSSATTSPKSATQVITQNFYTVVQGVPGPQGPQGPAGEPGQAGQAYIPNSGTVFGITAPGATNPGSIGSFTYGSAEEFITNKLKVTGALTFADGSTITGAIPLVWSNLKDPAANLSLNMGANTTTLTYNDATGASNLFNIADTAGNTGTGYLFNVATSVGSTAKPLRVAAGATEALGVDATGNVGIGTVSPSTKLDVAGANLNTSADGAIMSANFTGSITKNDSNTRTFNGVNINPTLNGGVSNANTTFNVLNLVTTNTSNTGITTNLIKATYNGSQRFLVDSTGNLTINGVINATSLGTQVIGATAFGNAERLKVIDNSSGTALAVLANGNVGVGTLAPGSRLEVNGNALINGNLTVQGANITFQNVTTGVLSNNSTTSGAATYVVGSAAVDGFLGLASTSGVGTTDYIKFNVGNNGGTEAMRIIHSGNVGIGTANPTFAFENYKNAADVATVVHSNGHARGGIAALASANDSVALFTTSANDSINIGYSGTTESTLGTNFVSRIYIKNSTGNVGIGTTNPLSKLDVNGGAAIGSYAGVNAAPSNGLIVSGSVGIGTTSSLSVLTVAQPADTTNIGGTTTANATKTITGVGTTFTNLSVGDRISLSSASSTYATITAIASDTSLTVDTFIGNGTSQTINLKKSIFRVTDNTGVGANNKVIVNDVGVGIGARPQAPFDVYPGGDGGGFGHAAFTNIAVPGGHQTAMSLYEYGNTEPFIIKGGNADGRILWNYNNGNGVRALTYDGSNFNLKVVSNNSTDTGTDSLGGMMLAALNGGYATGTDIAGSNLTIAGGRATGTAAGGDLIFQTTDPAGSTSASLDTLTTKMIVKGSGNVGIGVTAPISILDVVGKGTTPTTLTDNPLSSGATTINVASTTGFPTSGPLLIDSEIVTYTGTTATSFTGVTRGVYNTTAVSHALSAVVSNYAEIFRSKSTSIPNLSVLGDGSIYSPGSGTNSERFGALAAANASSTMAIGRNAQALSTGFNGGVQSIAIGENAKSQNHHAVIIGYNATEGTQGFAGANTVIGWNATSVNGNDQVVVLGAGAQATGNLGVAVGQSAIAYSSSVAVGQGATTGTNNSSIALGRGASTTASNQMVIGMQGDTVSGPIYDLYAGMGVTGSAPQSFTIHSTGGSGTDISGASLILAGGRPTGSGTGGSVIFQTAPAGAGGSSSQRNLSERMRIDQLGNVGIGNISPATRLDLTGLTLNTDADGKVAAANFIATVTKNDANTRTFAIDQIIPTINTGVSNTSTTLNILNIDTVNTTVTGVTTNLIKAGYGGTQKFLIDSTGAITSASLVSGGTQCLQASSAGVISGTGSACGAGGGGASIGGAVTSGTTGSVLFVNPSATLAQDNANLFFDATAHSLGIGNAAPATRLDVTGLTLNTDADNKVMSANFTGSITKNDSNTRTFNGVNINPTLNGGVSNANTTFNVLNLITTNTSNTGITTNLIKATYNGSQRFLVDSTGNLTLNGVITATSLSTQNIGAAFYGNATRFKVIDSGSNDAFAVLATGEVGIGNSTGLTTGKGLTITPTARTASTPSLLTIVGPADTALTASAEATDVNFNLARTVQFATGALATQRAVRIQAPTYAFVGASTITNAATLSISGAPVAGANATITNKAALVVESGNVGIGTAAPLYNLDVNGTVGLSDSNGRYTFCCGGSGSVAISGASNNNSGDYFRIDTQFTNRFSIDYFGNTTIAQGANNSGSPTGFTFNGGALTTLAASTEATDVNFNLARTVQFATGGLATQRAFKIQAPSYSFVGASTLAEADTVAIFGAPKAQTNATITTTAGLKIATSNVAPVGSVTNSYGLWVEAPTGASFVSAAAFFDGRVGIRDNVPTSDLEINGIENNLFRIMVSGSDRFVVSNGGNITHTQAVQTSGSPTALTVTAGAHTTLAASTEATDVNFNLARTVQFSTGALATQRAFRIQAPTYSFVGASTITDAANLSVSGAPIAGANATITSSHGLLISSNAVTSGVANAYGLTVNAPTGATNNFAAQFVGGSTRTLYVNGDSSLGDNLVSKLDDGIYLGRTKVSQNQLATSNVGNTWYPKGTSADRRGDTVGVSVDGKYMVAGMFGGNAQVSSDYGNTWTSKTTGSTGPAAVSADGKYMLLGGTLNNIQVSSDYGNTWTAKGASGVYMAAAMSADGKYQLVGDDNTDNFYLSNDYGATFNLTKATGSDAFGAAMSSDGKYQVILPNGNSIFRSTNYGKTWTSVTVNAGFGNQSGAAMSSDGKYVTVVGKGAGVNIYVSSDYGATFTAKASGRDWSGVAMTADGRIQIASVNTPGQIYVSTDFGNTWTAKDSNRTWNGVGISSDGKYAVAIDGTPGFIYVSTADSYVQSGNLAIGTSSPTAGNGLTVAPVARTSGSPALITVIGPADTTLTASTEATDINFNLARTVQFSTGALATQRAMRIQAPTYGFVGASTITTAATFAIGGAPAAGTNATITNAYSLYVEAGTTRLAGSVKIDLPGTGTANALCHTTQTGTTNEEIVDCTSTPAADYSENYPAAADVAEGDIVMPTKTMVTTTQNDQIATIVKSDASLDLPVIGVISRLSDMSDFNNIGNNIDKKDNPMPVALNGRVLVNVTEENGPIQIGDRLTLSKTLRGYAMKQTESGESVGIALQPSNGTGKIMVFLKLGYQHINVVGSDDGTTISYDKSLDLTSHSLLNVKSIASASGKWSIDENGNLVVQTIQANKLCLDDICITRDQLKSLLDNNPQTSGSVTQTPPTDNPNVTQTTTDSSVSDPTPAIEPPPSDPTTDTPPAPTTTP